MKTDTRLLTRSVLIKVLYLKVMHQSFLSFFGFKFIVHVLTALWNVLSLSQ